MTAVIPKEIMKYRNITMDVYAMREKGAGDVLPPLKVMPKKILI
jgi:hypothetical protein